MDLTLGHTPLIIETCKKHGLLRNQAAYVLATGFWETNRTMEPVREAYWLDEGWRKRNLRYYPWYGRGFVQLTWRDNYVRSGEKIGVDLTSDPDRAMVPTNAAEILVLGSRDGWFTGKKLSDYITLNRSDFGGARRIINGTDKAATIAEIAREYDADLLGAGYGVTTAPEKPQDAQWPAPEPEPTEQKKGGFFGRLWGR
jgi:hypothetical protein